MSKEEELPAWTRWLVGAGVTFVVLALSAFFVAFFVSLATDIYGEVYERFYCEGGIRCQKNHNPVRIEYRNTDDASVPPVVAEASR